MVILAVCVPAMLIRTLACHAGVQAAKAAFKLFVRNQESRVITHFMSSALFTASASAAASAAVLSVLHELHSAGEAIHCVTVFVSALLAASIFSHITSIARHAADAAAVCYVQDVEKCRPGPPLRCCSMLQNAVVACWDLLPEEAPADARGACARAVTRPLHLHLCQRDKAPTRGGILVVI